MNIEELRERATASELVLIDKIEELLATIVRRSLVEEVAAFIKAHNPPTKEDLMFYQNAFKDWFNKLNKYLKEDQ